MSREEPRLPPRLQGMPHGPVDFSVDAVPPSGTGIGIETTRKVDAGAYRVITFSTQDISGDGPHTKSYAVSGDHLYVSEVVGPLAVYVSLGSGMNPPIRLRPGMTITRPFTQLVFSVFDSQLKSLTQFVWTRVLCYVSDGSVIMEELDKAGANQFAMLYDRATRFDGNWSPLFDSADFPVGLNSPMTANKRGGFIKIINRDDTNDFHLSVGIPVFGAAWWSSVSPWGVGGTIKHGTSIEIPSESAVVGWEWINGYQMQYVIKGPVGSPVSLTVIVPFWQYDEIDWSQWHGGP